MGRSFGGSHSSTAQGVFQTFDPLSLFIQPLPTVHRGLSRKGTSITLPNLALRANLTLSARVFAAPTYSSPRHSTVLSGAAQCQFVAIPGFRVPLAVVTASQTNEVPLLSMRVSVAHSIDLADWLEIMNVAYRFEPWVKRPVSLTATEGGRGLLVGFKSAQRSKLPKANARIPTISNHCHDFMPSLSNDKTERCGRPRAPESASDTLRPHSLQ
jgi:hypothetical protein